MKFLSLLISWFYLIFITLSVMMVVSSSSMFSMWVGMELSSFFFIPILNKEFPGGISSLKYFLVQALSSLLFFFFGVVNELSSSLDLFGVGLSLLVKLSGFPFFGWLYHLMENIDWLSFFLLGSSQKIPPFIVLGKLSEQLGMWPFMMGLSLCIMSMFFMFSKFSIRWMLTSSSLFNMGWIFMSTKMGVNYMLTYMTIYFLFLFIVIKTFSQGNNEWVFCSNYKNFSMKFTESMALIISMLALIGVPPIGTFLGKVEILLGLIQNYHFLSCFVLVLTSTVILYFYFKVIFSNSLFISHSLTHNKSQSKVWLVVISLTLFSVWLF